MFLYIKGVFDIPVPASKEILFPFELVSVPNLTTGSGSGSGSVSGYGLSLTINSL